MTPPCANDNQEICEENWPIHEYIVEEGHHFEISVDGQSWWSELGLSIIHAKETRENESNAFEIDNETNDWN